MTSRERRAGARAVAAARRSSAAAKTAALPSRRCAFAEVVVPALLQERSAPSGHAPSLDRLGHDGGRLAVGAERLADIVEEPQFPIGEDRATVAVLADRPAVMCDHDDVGTAQPFAKG